MFKIQKIKIIIVVCLLLLSAVPTFAAEISFDAKTQEVSVGEQFEAGVFLNTENEEINAVEGKIVFPSELLELKEIRDGNSIVNFWIERPKVKSDNQIAFSGIIPGGYTGEKGLIFSAIFQSKNEREGIIEIQEAKTLLNDGKGTQASLSISNLQFLISKQVPSPQIPISEIKDIEPPEPFGPIIAQDPEIFNGKYFLVFATQDKGAGIDHYEILEKEQKSCIRGLIKKDEWQVVESPYLLKDQKLKSYIYIKAVDKTGNERIAVVEAKYPLKWYEVWWIWSIMLLVVILIVYALWNLKAEHRR